MIPFISVLGKFLLMFSLLIGLPVGLFVGTLALIGIVLIIVSIPVALCFWAHLFLQRCFLRLYS